MLTKYIVHDLTVILADYNYWAKNQTSLTSFCNTYHAQQQGMTVTMPSEQVLTIFMLAYTA